ncbi:MAG: AbrB/MazE/SpoVT family DNA-binding domain-containing protein [Candidatus Omnitrophica bacterium]|nr:AbrB/MazE/SpoVT family DNA-binding domain-containing protein [Candidatus Omnitrophota bacterium]
MTLTKLKSKNQVTLPSQLVKRLHLKINGLFSVDVEQNCIKLTPVSVEPLYSEEELEALDRVVEKEKGSAKKL